MASSSYKMRMMRMTKRCAPSTTPLHTFQLPYSLQEFMISTCKRYYDICVYVCSCRTFMKISAQRDSFQRQRNATICVIGDKFGKSVSFVDFVSSCFKYYSYWRQCKRFHFRTICCPFFKQWQRTVILTVFRKWVEIIEEFYLYSQTGALKTDVGMKNVVIWKRWRMI